MVRYCGEADEEPIAERWVGRSSGKPSLHSVLVAYSLGWPRICAQGFQFRSAGCLSLGDPGEVGRFFSLFLGHSLGSLGRPTFIKNSLSEHLGPSRPVT